MQNPRPTFDKAHIIDEIRRTAQANGGAPLGRARFQQETGIRRSDWYGRHWRNWSEAISEAGLIPNVLMSAYSDDDLLAKLASLVRECGHFPIDAEVRMKTRSDPNFPSATVFDRLGGKATRARKLVDYCTRRGDLDDVILLCASVTASEPRENGEAQSDDNQLAFVYLMKSGRFYKIGHTNAVGRREYELSIQLPERAKVVHEITTDDPHGIEEYWHRRFADKRKNGEWFDLTAADVAAFRRRRFQ